MPGYVPLPGTKRGPLPNSRAAGKIDASEPASLTLRVRSRGDLKELAKRVYREAEGPLKDRHYLTHAELERDYGADKADLDRIEHFAHLHDLMVAHRSSAERIVVVKGKLGDLLAAFP